VASVVVMLAVGEGSKRQVMAQMGAFGSNILYLSGKPQPAHAAGIVTLDDVAAMASCPRSSASCRSTARSRWCATATSQEFYVGGNNTNFPDLQLAGGRGQLLHRGRRSSGAAVAVIGQGPGKLFGEATRSASTS
jgi:macrolide transport system ATP-binding/permease protein